MQNRFAGFVVALLVVVADRLSKVGIERSLNALDSISIVPGWLRIIHTENPGAAFGLLAEGNAWLRSSILIGVSVLVMLFVAAALWDRKDGFTGTLPRLGLSLILGGAIGNLYDRILRGTVTDFVEVYHGTWSFPAFNVADSAITVGAALIIGSLLLTRRKHPRPEAQLIHK